MVERIEGTFYEPGSSRSGEATLLLESEGGVTILCGSNSYRYAKGEYLVEPPLGHLRRVLHCKGSGGEGRFETDDAAGFAEAERFLGSKSYWNAIAWLENHWKGSLASAGAVLFFLFFFFEWGVPLIAKKVAFDLPQSWRVAMTNQSLKLMEDWDYLGESELGEERIAEVQAVFERSLQVARADVAAFDYELQVVEGGGIGANAFALPSGVVIATDGFVRLCENDDQVMAVFLHEIEHVEQQHGIRALVQRGGVFLVFSILIGDASSAISLAEGLPSLVMNSRYSQKFELESDRFAAVVLEREGIGAERMEEVLLALTSRSEGIPVLELISTHPGLRKRLERIRAIRGAANGE